MSAHILIFISAFPAALLVAAINDINEFKIPNWISVMLIASYFIAGLSIQAPLAVLFEGVVLGLAALVVGFILFARNIVGGGDAKLFAATILWVGMLGLPFFLIYMGLAGGALALLLMFFRKMPPLPIYAQMPWVMRLHQNPSDIPYAVAICAGGLLSFKETRFFQLAFGG